VEHCLSRSPRLRLPSTSSSRSSCLRSGNPPARRLSSRRPPRSRPRSRTLRPPFRAPCSLASRAPVSGGPLSSLARTCSTVEGLILAPSFHREVGLRHEPSARRFSSYRLAMRYREDARHSPRSCRLRTSRLRRVPSSAPCSPCRCRHGRARRLRGLAPDSLSDCALAPRIDRFQRSCRAHPSCASLTKRRDELGHPGLSAALDWASSSAWGRNRRRPRSLFDRRLLLTILFPKTGTPAVSAHSTPHSHAAW